MNRPIHFYDSTSICLISLLVAFSRCCSSFLDHETLKWLKINKYDKYNSVVLSVRFDSLQSYSNPSNVVISRSLLLDSLSSPQTRHSAAHLDLKFAETAVIVAIGGELLKTRMDGGEREWWLFT